MNRKPTSPAREAKYVVVATETKAGGNDTLWEIGVFGSCGDACDCAKHLLTIRSLFAEFRVIRVQGRNEVTQATYRRE